MYDNPFLRAYLLEISVVKAIGNRRVKRNFLVSKNAQVYKKDVEVFIQAVEVSVLLPKVEVIP